jgi:hypothetical protein
VNFQSSVSLSMANGEGYSNKGEVSRWRKELACG